MASAKKPKYTIMKNRYCNVLHIKRNGVIIEMASNLRAMAYMVIHSFRSLVSFGLYGVF